MRYLIISLGTMLISCSIYAYFLRVDLTEAIESNIAYENSIAYQNLEIQRQRTDKEKALERIKQWKELPAVEKWKTITKVIYKDANISKEGVTCEQNKIIENNVYQLDWNNF